MKDIYIYIYIVYILYNIPITANRSIYFHKLQSGLKDRLI